MNKKIYIGFAFLVGLMSVLPYLIAYDAVDSHFGYKLHYFYQDSELVYLSRIREVTEGNIKITSPVFFEYKNSVNMQQPFGEWVYALGALGNPEFVPYFAMVSKFLFPALLFIIIYMLTCKVLGYSETRKKINQSIAVFVATFIVLGYDLTNIGFLRHVLSGSFSAPALSLWTRIVNPITGALGLFSLSYFLLVRNHTHHPFRIICAGLLLGLLSGYIFSFALGMVMMGCMFCFALLEKNWVRAKHLFYIISIAVLVNIFYIFSVLTATSDVSVLQKNGLLLTHQVLHNKVLYIALGAFVVATASRYYCMHERRFWGDVSWQWSVSTLLAGFVCLNQQVLTGKTVWPGHFVQYTNPLGYIIFFTSIFILADSVLEKLNENWQKVYRMAIISICLLGTVGIFAVNIIAMQPIATNSNREAYQDSQRYTPLFGWLKEHSGTQCVVFVAEEKERLEKYITAYTPCDLYHSSYVFVSVPPERILHNYLVHLRLLGVTVDTLQEYLDSHESDMNEYFFNDWADKFSDGHDYWVFNTRKPGSMAQFLPSTKSMVITAYKKIANEPIDTLLHTYAIEYIVFDTKYDTLSEEVLQGYPVVFKTSSLVVLKIPSIQKPVSQLQ
jgi:hypothetical protein